MIVNAGGSFSHTLAVSIPIIPLTPFTGPKTLWGNALNREGAYSGWIQPGTWTLSNHKPLANSLSATGTASTQTFTLTISDVDTAPNLWAGYVELWNASGVVTCGLQFDYLDNLIYILNAAANGWTDPTVPGVQHTLSNGNCSVNASLVHSSISGNNRIVSLPIKALSGMNGAQTPRGLALDLSNDSNTQYSSWYTGSVWQASASTPVSASCSGFPANPPVGSQ